MQFLIFILFLIAIALVKGYFSKIKKGKPMSSEDKRINHLEIIMSIADSGQLPELKKAIDKANLIGDEEIMIKGVEYTVNQARGIVIIGEEYLRNKNQLGNEYFLSKESQEEG
jgi:hypothetical protein